MNTLVGNYELARVVEVWSLKAKPFFLLWLCCFGFSRWGLMQPRMAKSSLYGETRSETHDLPILTSWMLGFQGCRRSHPAEQFFLSLSAECCLFNDVTKPHFRTCHTCFTLAFCVGHLNGFSSTFFSTHLCVVLRVLKHGGKEYGSRFQGELSDGHK